MFYRVRLSEPVPPEEMEQILIDAAKEIGCRAKVYDRMNEYYELVPVERVEEYAGTRVKLRKFIFPVLEVEFDKRDLVDSLYLEHTGIGFKGKRAVGYLQNQHDEIKTETRFASLLSG